MFARDEVTWPTKTYFVAYDVVVPRIRVIDRETLRTQVSHCFAIVCSEGTVSAVLQQQLRPYQIQRRHAKPATLQLIPTNTQCYIGYVHKHTIG